MRSSRSRSNVPTRSTSVVLTALTMLSLGAVLSSGADPVGAAEWGAVEDGAGASDDESRIVQDVGDRARFTSDGRLERPEDWRTWALAGASMGLSYSDEAGPMQHFHRVYTQPWAFEHALETGEFAEGTMFILEFHVAEDDANPARNGFYEGERIPFFEVHVKKAGLHESGWGFFGFADTTSVAEMISPEASCYSCHAAEADADNVFVQFYPELRARMGRGAADDAPADDASAAAGG